MDYDDLVNRTWEDIPEPQLLPGGLWLNTGRNAGFMKPREEGQSAKVVFFYKPKEAIQVNEEDLAELGDDYDLSINDLTYTIYIESAADWDKVRKHMALHGVTMSGPLFDENGKLALNKKFKGAEVVAEVGQRSYDNDAGETIWQNTMAKFAKVAE